MDKTSGAPIRGCSPSCLVISMFSEAYFTSGRPLLECSSSPTSVKTLRTTGIRRVVQQRNTWNTFLLWLLNRHSLIASFREVWNTLNNFIYDYLFYRKLGRGALHFLLSQFYFDVKTILNGFFVTLHLPDRDGDVVCSAL